MPISRTYGCPDCGGTFRFLHMTREEGPPLNCSICNGYMGEDAEPELSAPKYVGTPLAQSVDKVYRDLEKSTGVTNLRDNIRPGESAMAQVRNTVTEVADSMGHSYWGGDIGSHIAASKEGPSANITGGNVLNTLRGRG